MFWFLPLNLLLLQSPLKYLLIRSLQILQDSWSSCHYWWDHYSHVSNTSNSFYIFNLLKIFTAEECCVKTNWIFLDVYEAEYWLKHLTGQLYDNAPSWFCNFIVSIFLLTILNLSIYVLVFLTFHLSSIIMLHEFMGGSKKLTKH